MAPALVVGKRVFLYACDRRPESQPAKPLKRGLVGKECFANKHQDKKLYRLHFPTSPFPYMGWKEAIINKRVRKGTDNGRTITVLFFFSFAILFFLLGASQHWRKPPDTHPCHACAKGSRRLAPVKQLWNKPMQKTCANDDICHTCLLHTFPVKKCPDEIPC